MRLCAGIIEKTSRLSPDGFTNLRFAALANVPAGTPFGKLSPACGEAAYRFISKRIEGYDATQPMHRAGAAPVHDALAVCAVIDPSVITTHFIPVDVETGGELSVGRTVCDFRFHSRRTANVHFAMDADEPKFVSMLTGILGRML